jgi:sortase A
VTRRRAFAAFACLLLALSLWQAGAGAYIHVKAGLAQILIDDAWRRTQAGDISARPWPWADTRPLARLEIPHLDASLIVLSGSSGRTLAFGPGHVDGSVLPGQLGVSLIAGHRDTHFRLLEGLAVGETIIIEDREGIRHGFKVTATRIVDARRVRINVDATKPRLVLSTCYPFDAIDPGGPLRFLVVADLYD